MNFFLRFVTFFHEILIITYSALTVKILFVDVKLWNMLGASAPGFPIRLCGILGFDGRINDVVYCHPLVQSEKKSTVVYFGGDMQVTQKKISTEHNTI